MRNNSHSLSENHHDYLGGNENYSLPNYVNSYSSSGRGNPRLAKIPGNHADMTRVLGSLSKARVSHETYAIPADAANVARHKGFCHSFPHAMRLVWSRLLLEKARCEKGGIPCMVALDRALRIGDPA